MTDKTAPRQDIYSRVTAQIIAELEQGVRPWHKPWAADHIAGPISRPLRANGKPYSGINIIMLWATAMQRGYPMQSPYVAVANKQVDIMVRIASEFGMTPGSRTRIRVGERTPEDPFEAFLQGRG